MHNKTLPPYIYEYEQKVFIVYENKTNAADFINVIKQYSIVYISAHSNNGLERYLKNWPPKSDIPYLLSIKDSQEKCGVIGDLFSSQAIMRDKTNNTVGNMAIHLLKAIKEKSFYLYPPVSQISQEEHLDIINWANDALKQDNIEK